MLQNYPLNQQRLIIHQFFTAILCENTSKKDSLAAILVEVLKNFIQIHEAQSQLIVEQISVLTEDAFEKNMLCGYRILKSIMQLKKLKGGFSIVKSGLLHPLPNYSIKALKLCAFLLKQSRAIENQIQIRQIYNTISILVEKHKDGRALEILLQMVKQHFHYFQKTSEELMKLLKQFTTMNNEEFRNISIRILITILSKGKFIQQSFIFYQFQWLLAQINPQISKKWMDMSEIQDQPKKIDAQIIKFGVTIVSSAISTLGQALALPLVKHFVQSCLAVEDWRFRYAAIVLISSVPEYMERPSELLAYLCKIYDDFFHNDNPKLRSAVCEAIQHILSQGSNQITHDLARGYFQTMLDLFHDEKVPIVKLQVIMTLLEIFKSLNQRKLKKDLEFTRLNKLITDSASYLQSERIAQKIFEAILIIAKKAQQYFLPYFETSMNVFFIFLKSQKGSITIKAKAIDMLSQILIYFEPNQDYLREFITHIINVQNTLGQELGADMKPSHFYEAWLRLCRKYPKVMNDQLKHFFPSLLSLIIKDVHQDRTIVKQISNGFDQVYEYLALQIIEVIIEKFSQTFETFVDDITQFLQTIMRGKYSHQKKMYSYFSLEKIFNKYKVKLGQFTEITIFFTKYLLSDIGSILKHTDVKRQICILKETCKLYCLFSQAQAQQVISRLLRIQKRQQLLNIVGNIIKHHCRHNGLRHYFEDWLGKVFAQRRIVGSLCLPVLAEIITTNPTILLEGNRIRCLNQFFQIYYDCGRIPNDQIKNCILSFALNSNLDDDIQRIMERRIRRKIRQDILNLIR